MRIPLLLAILCLVPAPALADPPEETLERLREALEFLAPHGPARSATVQIRTVISRPDGSNPEEQIRRVTVAVSDDGTVDHTTVKVLQDGVDVTDDEAAQESFGKPSEEEAESIESAEGGDEGGSFSISLSLPYGDDRADYTFGPTRTEGAAQVASFEPVDGMTRKQRKKLAVGVLAWDPHTLDPLWIEFGPDLNPAFVNWMDSRMSFTRKGAWIYPDSSKVEGVGGFLLYRRKMVFEMALSDVK